MYTLSLTAVTETEESGHEAGYSRNLRTDPDTRPEIERTSQSDIS
jgi:hypothetical protein